MSRALTEGQFELDGDLFLVSKHERGEPFHVQDLDTGTSDPRTQDADRPLGDGRMFGADFYSAPTWTFTLWVQDETDPALDHMGVLKAAWQNRALRRTPGATQVLRYTLKGRTRRVYGRGRKCEPANVRQGVNFGFLPALAEFDLVDPLTYDDAEVALSLDLVTDAGPGITWPITWPVTWGAPAGLRQGVVNVAGEEPTPFTVTVTGPTSGKALSPYVAGPGWWVELPGLELAYNQQLVIDTRAHTVKVDGVSVAGFLSRRSSLTARLAPGSQELLFGATDPTNTARAVVSWRPAHASL